MHFKLSKFNKFDYKKFYYRFRFGKLPYKDLFIHKNSFRLPFIFNKLVFYTHCGKRWFKIKVSFYNSGLSPFLFKWTKLVAIYKKKQYLKKKK